jgi:hypothetical protein
MNHHQMIDKIIMTFIIYKEYQKNHVNQSLLKEPIGKQKTHAPGPKPFFNPLHNQNITVIIR